MENVCAICCKEISEFQLQRLADGNCICRNNCREKCLKKYFNFIHADIEKTNAHILQVEDGTIIFNDLFVPLFKSIKTKPKRFGEELYVSRELGLMALAPAEYKFGIFGKTYPKVCIYRIGDLAEYVEKERNNMPLNQDELLYARYIHFIFKDTKGLDSFYYACENPPKVIDYFDRLLSDSDKPKDDDHTELNQRADIALQPYI